MKHPKVERVCKACGDPFLVYYSETLKSPGHGHYCSIKCRGVRVSEVHTGKIVSQKTRDKMSAAKVGYVPWNKDHLSKPPVVATCPNCQQQFSYLSTQRSKGKQTYCSYECSQEFIRKNPSAHPRYKGNPKNRKYGPRWDQVAVSIRERDNYTCQNCGLVQVSPSLVVHHIKRRSDFNDDFALANDPSNLITLCRPCHRLLEPPS